MEIFTEEGDRDSEGHSPGVKPGGLGRKGTLGGPRSPGTQCHALGRGGLTAFSPDFFLS